MKKISDAFKNGQMVCVKQAIAELGSIGKTLIAVEYEYGNKQLIDAFRYNVQHILEITRHAERMLDNDKEAQEKIAWLYHVTGFGFDYSGQYNDALLWYQKALDIRKKVFGKDNPKAIYKTPDLHHIANEHI